MCIDDHIDGRWHYDAVNTMKDWWIFAQPASMYKHNATTILNNGVGSSE